MARLMIACALVACSSSCSSSKKDKPPPDKEPVQKPAAADAAGEKGAPAPVPVDRGDPAAAAEIVANYTALRALFGKTADDEVKLSAKQKKALLAVAGADGLKEASEAAADAGWGEAVARAWLERMSADARKGLRSIVRLPLWQCIGWGSATPSAWVAAGCFNAAVFFVTPTGDTRLIERCDACTGLTDGKIDECRDKRCFLVAEGYFTGKLHETEDGPPGEPGPVAHEFHIERARIGKQGRLTLRLPGGAPPAAGPPIADGPKWGVMYADAFATDPNVAKKAADRAAQLKAAGFDAEIIDSRRISSLWCCSQALLIGRFDSREKAQARAQEILKAKLPRPIVRQLYP